MHGRDNLTPKQASIYRLIVVGYRAGLTPTHQEIGDMLGITKTTVYEHITNLVLKGYITKTRQRRSIKPCEPLDPRYVDIVTSTTILANAAVALTTAMDADDRQKYQRFIDCLESAVCEAQA